MNGGGGHQARTFQTNAGSELGEQISADELRQAGTQRRAGALQYVAHSLTVMIWISISGRKGK